MITRIIKSDYTDYIVRIFCVLILCLFISACGTWTTTVRYYLPPADSNSPLSQAVKRIFVVQRTEKPESDEVGSDLISRKTGGNRISLPRTASYAMSRRICDIFKSPFSRVIGYQTAYSNEIPSMMKDFAPSSSLWLYPSELEAQQTEKEIEVKTKDKKIIKKKVYPTTGSMKIRYQLYSEPEHILLKESDITSTIEQEFSEKSSDLKWWLSSISKSLAEKWVPKLETELSLAHNDKPRTILAGEKKSELNDAFKKAKKNQWTEAVVVWEKYSREHPEDWISVMNSGIYYEKNMEFKEALVLYNEALRRLQVKTPQDSHAQNIAVMIKEVENASASGNASRETWQLPAWLTEPWAILPFENEAVDLTGHEYTRKFVYSWFRDGGYNVLPIEDTDEKLRNLGITQGGQLIAYFPEQIAKDLNCRWLVYGRIIEFKSMNLGIYQRRQVQINLKIVDGRTGKTHWEDTQQVINETLAHPGIGFVAGVIKDQVQKTARTFLSEEAQESVIRMLESFPFSGR